MFLTLLIFDPCVPGADMLLSTPEGMSGIRKAGDLLLSVGQTMRKDLSYVNRFASNVSRARR